MELQFCGTDCSAVYDFLCYLYLYGASDVPVVGIKGVLEHLTYQLWNRVVTKVSTGRILNYVESPASWWKVP